MMTPSSCRASEGGGRSQAEIVRGEISEENIDMTVLS